MKRTLAVLIVFCLILAAPGFSRAETRLTGDLDSDGEISASDAAKVLRAAGGIVTPDAAVSAIADATGNMEVGTADAVAILLYATGEIDAFSDLAGLSADSLLGEKYLEKFSYRGIVSQNGGYRSRVVSVNVSSGESDGFVYWVADVYVQSVESIHTAFGGGEYLGGRETTQQLAIANGAILAINGDGYSGRQQGPLVRNGVWYRDTIDIENDICVLFANGELTVYASGSVTAEELADLGVYQTWTGGVRLLDGDGEALASFGVQGEDTHTARTAIGYYEPGHYCFITADGRQNAASSGATLAQLARLASGLGCVSAYSLLGGNSTVMATQTGVINYNPDGGRTVSDIVYVCEPVQNGGE
ncbi:MAG TPA: phosphodiester glycosidase family protein [Eubacteriales bacterium]|nr:phosphodiester glycosidase family protein [Eubacteriales bacterium]